MFRTLLLLVILAALASLMANLLEYGGLALHPRHGSRLVKAAAREGMLVQFYTTAGRATLPLIGLDDRAREAAKRRYAAAFDKLDASNAALDERALGNMVNVPGVARPGWLATNLWMTPLLFVAVLLLWIFRPREVHNIPNQRSRGRRRQGGPR